MKHDDINLGISDELHNHCRWLFNAFCERRSVIPLAYLLHVWPLTSNTKRTLATLSETLRNLKAWHPEKLAKEEHLMLDRVLDLAVTDNSESPGELQPSDHERS